MGAGPATESFFTDDGQSGRGGRPARRRRPRAWWWPGCWPAATQVVGRVNLNNLVIGVLRSASVGYWVDAAHQGRGLATGAVEFACAQARGRGLHRVEAGTLLHNTASQRVLERCGFEYYGTARKLPVHRRRVAGPPALPADPARRPARSRLRRRTRRNRSVRGADPSWQGPAPAYF